MRQTSGWEVSGGQRATVEEGYWFGHQCICHCDNGAAPVCWRRCFTLCPAGLGAGMWMLTTMINRLFHLILVATTVKASRFIISQCQSHPSHSCVKSVTIAASNDALLAHWPQQTGKKSPPSCCTHSKIYVSSESGVCSCPSRPQAILSMAQLAKDLLAKFPDHSFYMRRAT